MLKERGTRIMPNTGLPFMQGNVWHVRPYNGSDSNYGDHPDSAFKSLSQAQSKAVADQNDTVLFYAESNTAALTTDYQTTGLAWAKDSVHLIGVNDGSFIGQRSRVAVKSTATSGITDLFTLSGNNCLVRGIEFYQGVPSSVAAAVYRSMVISGSRNRVDNCQISGIGDTSMDLASSCSLEIDGDENIVSNSYIGLDTYLRATATSEVYITGTRNTIDRSIVNSYTANASFKAITWAAGSYHTKTWLRETMLCADANRTGVAVPTGAMLFNAAGTVDMLGGGIFGYTYPSTSANANIRILADWGLPTAANYPGIAKGAAIT
jgi:hypothetical protein